jgi:hypothetical protein
MGFFFSYKLLYWLIYILHLGTGINSDIWNIHQKRMFLRHLPKRVSIHTHMRTFQIDQKAHAKKTWKSQVPWLVPIILATQEAQIDCLANMRPWVQTPYSQKQTKNTWNKMKCICTDWPSFHAILFSFFCSTGVWTQDPHLELLHQPFFVMDLFEIGSRKLFAQGWFWTMILLISASWVAMIPGVSHHRPGIMLHS